ncbi:MAG TPA: hypothetical protein VEW04_11120 [Allosphingosinicella sp.]|nr:hypothetical protein [Allosphingosinicella sp.]
MKLPANLFRGRASPKLERLEAEVIIERSRLEKRKNLAEDPEAAWLKAAERALTLATLRLSERRIDPAWKYLHEARRQEIFGFRDEEIEALAKALRNEAATKLGGWRQLTVNDLVKPILDHQPPHDEGRRCRLANAMQLRDENHDNRYFKLDLLHRQVAILLVLFFALLTTLIVLLMRNPDLLSGAGAGESPRLGPWQLLAGAVIGALGACFSGLASLAGSSADVSIPERVASTAVTFARPAIGAASALAAMLLLGGGLLGEMGAGALFAVAFAFGFSERLAIGALERATGR